jgi:hypothetical protein
MCRWEKERGRGREEKGKAKEVQLKVREVDDSIKPGVERSRTPGTPTPKNREPAQRPRVISSTLNLCGGCRLLRGL